MHLSLKKPFHIDNSTHQIIVQRVVHRPVPLKCDRHRHIDRGREHDVAKRVHHVGPGPHQGERTGHVHKSEELQDKYLIFSIFLSYGK